eukprot:11787993-Karenia_brevis.AAC.1
MMMTMMMTMMMMMMMMTMIMAPEGCPYIPPIEGERCTCKQPHQLQPFPLSCIEVGTGLGMCLCALSDHQQDVRKEANVSAPAPGRDTCWKVLA